MKTKNKALLLSLCAVLLVAATVLCTIAWLTAEQTVTNTFTYGKVAIELKEPKTDAFGEYYYLNVSEDTTTEPGAEYYNFKPVTENSYTLRPAHEYLKHPYIEILDGSEPCYLFVKIENQLADIEAPHEETNDGYSNIASQMKSCGWKPVEGHAGVYVYCGLPSHDGGLGGRAIASYDTTAGGKYYEVFTCFKVKGDVAGDELENYSGNQIIITAYAVQADGFENTKSISDADLWKTAFPDAAKETASAESSAESSDAAPTT